MVSYAGHTDVITVRVGFVWCRMEQHVRQSLDRSDAVGGLISRPLLLVLIMYTSSLLQTMPHGWSLPTSHLLHISLPRVGNECRVVVPISCDVCSDNVESPKKGNTTNKSTETKKNGHRPKQSQLKRWTKSKTGATNHNNNKNGIRTNRDRREKAMSPLSS